MEFVGGHSLDEKSLAILCGEAQGHGEACSSGSSFPFVKELGS